MRSCKILRKIHGTHLSIRLKFTLALGAIAVMLLVSCIISVMEYSRMSNYVSTLIADDISSINVAEKLGEECTSYNLALLAVIGDESSNKIPPYDETYFKTHCDSLRNTLSSVTVSNLADSVMYSYAAYMLTSYELEDVMSSNFIDSRTWFFDRLQPRYIRLRSDIEKLSEAIHQDLRKNSATFERGFYRSVIPGIVAVGVGLLMILMLYLFILSYYLTPLSKIQKELEAYISNDKKYSCNFEGDDELKAINQGIADITSENRQLRSRLRELRLKSKE